MKAGVSSEAWQITRNTDTLEISSGITFFVSSFSKCILINGGNKSVTPSLIISAIASSKTSAGDKPNYQK